MKTLLASWSRCGRTVCKLHSRVSWSSWSSKSMSWSSCSPKSLSWSSWSVTWSSLLSQSVTSSSLSGVVVKIIVLLNMVIVMITRSGQSKLHYVLFLAKVKVKFLVARDIQTTLASEGRVFSKFSGSRDLIAQYLGGCDNEVDSIAVSLFGNVTVDTREIHIITKEQKIQIIILILKRGPCLIQTRTLVNTDIYFVDISFPIKKGGQFLNQKWIEWIFLNYIAHMFSTGPYLAVFAFLS